MINNGEKYACESCIRGHRVAQCQHTGEYIIYVFQDDMINTDACRSPSSKSREKGPPGIAVQSLSHSSNLKISSYQLQMRLDFSSSYTQAVRPRYVPVFHSSKILADRAFTERCLCDEGGDCTCAYKTGRKHCASSSSTSSPSAISSLKSPEMAALSPHLAYATPIETIARDTPSSDGTYSALSSIHLNSEHSEPLYVAPNIDHPQTVHDICTTPPDNVTHLATSQTPDWLGALDAVLGPTSDELSQCHMGDFYDPLLSMDPFSLAHVWDDLPQSEQPDNTDPVLAFDTQVSSVLCEDHEDHQQSFDYGL